jgi:hypothetical protein
VTEVVFSPGRLLYYNACAGPACKNCKVEEHGGIMICKKCGNQVTTPKERFAFLFRAADFTGSGYISALGDDAIGQPIIGYGAHEWAELTRNEDMEGCQQRVRVGWFLEFRIKVRIKADDYGGDVRPKMTAFAVTKLNYAEAAKFFAGEILKY